MVRWSIELAGVGTVEASAEGADDPLVRYRWSCSSCGEDVAVLAEKLSVALEAHEEDCVGAEVCSCGDCLDCENRAAANASHAPELEETLRRWEADQAGDDVVGEAIAVPEGFDISLPRRCAAASVLHEQLERAHAETFDRLVGALGKASS